MTDGKEQRKHDAEERARHDAEEDARYERLHQMGREASHRARDRVQEMRLLDPKYWGWHE